MTSTITAMLDTKQSPYIPDEWELRVLARHHTIQALDLLWHEFVDDCCDKSDEREYYDAAFSLLELERFLGKATVQQIENDLLKQFFEAPRVDDTPEKRAKRLLFVERMKICQASAEALDGQ